MGATGGTMSSLFGGILKPGDGAMVALRRELESRRDRWDRTGYHYRGSGDFILRHGQFWQGRVVAERYLPLMGEANQCFANAHQAALQDSSLRYVEGVYSTGGSHFTSHAWCVDTEGALVEVTFPTHALETYIDVHGRPILSPEHWAYAGVIFPELEFIEWHGTELGFPILDRPHADHTEVSPHLDMSEDHDWPVLKVPFDPSRKSLP